jgi:arsenite methyltransferase
MPDVTSAVKTKYGAIAEAVSRSEENPGCCGPSPCGCSSPISSNLYSDDEQQSLPGPAIAASLGCGNPTALIALEPGQVVLDLGSGGGIDVLLSAKRVGPSGRVYGLDMTDQMLELARNNQRAAGVTNVEFLQGTIEAIPLPSQSVDVIISNCVINLSTDKDAVLREAFRVLKPGGRFAVSDVVVRGDVPPDVRKSLELWVGCIAGALEERDYMARLQRAGFQDVVVEPWRVYTVEDARTVLTQAGLDVDGLAQTVDGCITSAFVRARKPAQACCGPTCCSADAGSPTGAGTDPDCS